ncbi:hypothetical protein Clacol_008138 [Clathrus columnatus]|uniref:Helicase ATP-binding domain-containing protein n=1 Tax=Clathrus columnatus TaxID=1419009 RepID=A0AAV5AN85_9AGAM|nr:hypothetical protein Clacol_008138 [Clathrus columnatus]
MYDEETLLNLLKTHFGWHNFRHKQVEAIKAVLNGENVFIRSATGSGKSLTWQLPALARAHIAGLKKLTVVVYPTKSLLLDQQAKLHGIDLNLVCCHGDQAFKATQKALDRLELTSNDMPDILLTIPEYLDSVYSPLCTILHRLQQKDKLGLIVIDEAQQVLQWGVNFRQTYLDFANVISERFPRIPRLALSAAITDNNIRETVKVLGMENHILICETLDHPNIYYEKDTMTLTIALLQAGIRAACYNAGLETRLRENAAAKWSNGEVDVLVATPAFLFGIAVTTQIVE